MKQFLVVAAMLPVWLGGDAKPETLPAVNIAGLAQALPETVYLQMDTHPACVVCQQQKRLFAGSGMTVAYREVQFNRPLPQWHLVRDGKIIQSKPAGALTIDQAQTWLASNQLAGVVISSIEAKPQVEALIKALRPFLDGGTLELTYTAPRGVVRDFIEIRQGGGSIKIPSRTKLVIGMDGDTLSAKFMDTKPRVGLGWLSRDVNAIEVTPDMISIRLPWAPDPEVRLK
jgi:hypothetical protein